MDTKVWVDAPMIIYFGNKKYLPAQDGAALHTIGTANDILLDLEGDRECADEDTRKRVSYVTSQNAEISSLL